MLDIRLIRENPDLVREALKKRGEAVTYVDSILVKHEAQRRLLQQIEHTRANINRFGQEIGAALDEVKVQTELLRKYENAKDTMQARDVERQIDELGEIIKNKRGFSKDRSEQLARLEPQLLLLEAELNSLLLNLPNLPHESVPVGQSSEDNKLVRSWGTPREFTFTPRPHWELGERLGIIDFERGAKLSGTRFYVLRGLGSRLQRSLINFMLDLHITEHGYTEIYPPFMVKGQCLYGSGNLPKFGDNLYHDAEEDFWWVPTAEVPLTNLHREEILPPGSLPIYYVAYTACFRREKMAAGKDTRGLKRGHQFDKVELYKFTEPDKSFDELEKLVHDAEAVAQRLGLAYRVVQLCTGDLGFTSAKSYDIEVWAPGCGEWLEVSSCSNCADFQARRASIRYRPSSGSGHRPQFVHTLNGSGLALPRIVIAILENYQQADGSVVVPEALRPYMKADVIA